MMDLVGIFTNLMYILRGSTAAHDEQQPTSTASNTLTLNDIFSSKDFFVVSGGRIEKCRVIKQHPRKTDYYITLWNDTKTSIEHEQYFVHSFNEGICTDNIANAQKLIVKSLQWELRTAQYHLDKMENQEKMQNSFFTKEGQTSHDIDETVASNIVSMLIANIEFESKDVDAHVKTLVRDKLLKFSRKAVKDKYVANCTDVKSILRTVKKAFKKGCKHKHTTSMGKHEVCDNCKQISKSKKSTKSTKR